MGKATVWRHVERAGVHIGKHALAKNERLIIETALREAGLRLRQIAARVGISRPSALRLLTVT
ncbi:MAG: hypothetical protein LBG60_09690 [Bifidobacteriaceae bacterium]|nr:hypothetical protein [Bifidobacteriaceae bacterium]